MYAVIGKRPTIIVSYIMLAVFCALLMSVGLVHAAAPLCNEEGMTLMGRKGIVPVYRFTLDHCVVLHQSRLYLARATAEPTAARFEQMISRYADGGNEQAYAYEYTGQESADPSLPFAQRFPGRFFATQNAMQGALGQNLQEFAARNGITWMGAGDVSPTPSALYLVVVVDPSDATLMPLRIGTGDHLVALSMSSTNMYRIDLSTLAVQAQPVSIPIDDPEELIPSAANQFDGLGVYWSGTPGLFRLNSATGQAELGPSLSGLAGEGTMVAEGMAAIGPWLYASADVGPGGYCLMCSHTLLRIDPTSGASEAVGPFGSDFLDVEGMAYSPTYGLVASDLGTQINMGTDAEPLWGNYHTLPSLFSVDLQTGQGTKIGSLAPPNKVLVSNPHNDWLSLRGPYVSALAFGPDDTLYAVTMETIFGGDAELWILDPTNARILSRRPLGIQDVQAMMYVPGQSISDRGR